MGDRTFDDLARALAQPMQRRHALRLLGGALATAVVPGMVPRAARATTPQGCDNPDLCAKGSTVCGEAGKNGCNSKCIPNEYAIISLCCPSYKYGTTVCRAGREACNNNKHLKPGEKPCKCLKPCGADCCAAGDPLPPEKCVKVSEGGKKVPKCVKTTCSYEDFIMKSLTHTVDYDPETQCCTEYGVQPKTGNFRVPYCAKTLTQRPGYKATTNGCGPEGSKGWPQGYHGGTEFRAACNAHDLCYGTCGKPKEACDQLLKIQLQVACEKTYAGDAEKMSGCLSLAETGDTLVRWGGEGAYEDAQQKACQCCP